MRRVENQDVEFVHATRMRPVAAKSLSTREHIIMLEARGKGLMGTLLRYPYEVRDEADYFEDIPSIKSDSSLAMAGDQNTNIRFSGLNVTRNSAMSLPRTPANTT